MTCDPNAPEGTFTTVQPGGRPVRDKRSGLIVVPLVLREGARGEAVGETALRLDGVGAELLHAYLTRALDGVDGSRERR
ncbi:hypothetical protein B4N89_19320 [Embleya scabrispora]|uniref:Uncharacterized protein n=1 Tax=Embleya scabrispora TaxID=159449 RepID=A0A1T3P1N6_9ACTN|nr:hypothetical protein [Embleya scabrispora]OPC82800.1 hypothetical protein B4N89_19320 [Embleya scabrispora]